MAEDKEFLMLGLAPVQPLSGSAIIILTKKAYLSTPRTSTYNPLIYILPLSLNSRLAK